MGVLEVAPERLTLRLEGPAWLLEASGVRREYEFAREDVREVLVTRSGGLRLLHDAVGVPVDVGLSGEWDLIEALRDARYPIHERLQWSLSRRRAFAVLVVAIELGLLSTFVVSPSWAVALAALLGMPVAAIVFWRLQRSV